MDRKTRPETNLAHYIPHYAVIRQEIGQPEGYELFIMLQKSQMELLAMTVFVHVLCLHKASLTSCLNFAITAWHAVVGEIGKAFLMVHR